MATTKKTAKPKAKASTVSVKQTPGIGKGTPGPGRKKGVPNKTTMLAKEAIAQAAEALGGAERLTTWAREDARNEHAFWATIYPKLLPLQVTGADGGPMVFERIVREIVKAP